MYVLNYVYVSLNNYHFETNTFYNSYSKAEYRSEYFDIKYKISDK